MQKPPFELRILGHTEFSGPDAEKADSVVRQSKRLALLAYLALTTAEGFRRRDQIIALFWPELEQSQARTYLRKTLYTIRESLGEDLFSTRGEDEIRVDPARLWCDAVALGQCIREGQWSDALSLYRGELLEGLFPEGVAQEFQEWLSTQRTALRQQAARAAWECSRLEEERGDRTAAAVMARRARELDPDNEEGVRQLMGLLDRRGNRGGALRVYTEWRARLAEEFGVEPDPQTRKLAHRIEATRTGESQENLPERSPAPIAPAFERPPAVSRSLVADAAVEEAIIPPTPRTARRRWQPYAIVGGLAGLVLIVAAQAYTRRSPPHAEPNSVAVLRVRPIGDSALRDLAGIMADELTTILARDTTLIVRTSRGPRDVDTRGGGDGVGPANVAAYVTDGEIHHAAEKLRLTLRLLAAQDGRVVWAASFDIDTTDAVVLVSRAAVEAATAISSALADSRRGAVARP